MRPLLGPVFNNIADKEYYSIKIHPNPGDQETNISYKSSVTDARITFEIFDISGKVVYKSDMDSAGRSEFVNTSDFATGVYMVKIMLDGELSGIEKLMIAR